jgi:ribosomal protein S18 acetylase RimI-like enzyme
MKNFTITPVTESDVPALLSMIRELAEFEHLSHEVVIGEDLLRAALFGERPVAAALLARVEGAVAGYAVYYRTFSTFVGRPGIYLEDIYVRPQFRQQGLGRAMLETVAKASIALGGGRLEWSALHWNENALRFYRGLGARVLDEWALLRMTGGQVRQLVDGQIPAGKPPGSA